METLHLIVHKAALEKRDSLSHIPEDARRHLNSVLERISLVLAQERNVMVLEGQLYGAKELCKGYASVILYGLKREICLRAVSEYLSAQGYIVSWDIAGTR